MPHRPRRAGMHVEIVKVCVPARRLPSVIEQTKFIPGEYFEIELHRQLVSQRYEILAIKAVGK